MAGFEAGADDYISKPCAPDVLLAKIRTWLRRSGASVPKSTGNAAMLTWGDLGLDLDAGRVTIGDREIVLTATEYNLLKLFLRNPDRIFSRSVILDRLWGLEDAPSDRAIVTYVKDVRKKLKAGGLTDEIIETVYGMGYRLKPVSPSPPAENIENNDDRKPAAGNRAAIAQIFQRFRGQFTDQMAVLEQANLALRESDAISVQAAQAAKQTAHKLAGSLASFGYPNGSKLARSIEHLLGEAIFSEEISSPDHSSPDHSSPDHSSPDRSFATATLARLTQLVTALRQELSRDPIASVSSPVSSAVSSPISLAISSAISSPVSSAVSSAAPVQTDRVLVVDDDTALTDRLKAESAAWGLHLDVAADLAEVRSGLTANPPDAVLLDLGFQQEAGFTLLREIRERFADLPVIVLTGRDSLADRLAVSRLGARQFLHKSAPREQIFRTIARVLAKPQTTDASVLIVDDDPALLALLTGMLTPWGIAVTTLSNPQQFWNVLAAINPDLVLLDLEMPQISGLDLCQVVRQDPQWETLPLLVVTAHTDAESLQQAFAAGADDFIAKPVLGPELVTRVLSRIDRSRLRKTAEKFHPATQGDCSQ